MPTLKQFYDGEIYKDIAKAGDADILYKRWLAIIDKRTTYVCQTMHGQLAGAKEDFLTPNGQLEGPPAHFGCRSVVDLAALDKIQLVYPSDRMYPHPNVLYDQNQSKKAVANFKKITKDPKINKKLVKETFKPPKVPSYPKPLYDPTKAAIEIEFSMGYNPTVSLRVRPPQAEKVVAKPRAAGQLPEVKVDPTAMSPALPIKAEEAWANLQALVYEDVKATLGVDWVGSSEYKRYLMKKHGSKLFAENSEEVLRSAFDTLYPRAVELRYAGVSLSQATALDIAEDLAARIINQWATTSGDSNSVSMLVQKIAGEEFGGTLSSKYLTKTLSTTVKEMESFALDPDVRKVVTDILRNSYDETQMLLKQAGITDVPLFRGAGGSIQAPIGVSETGETLHLLATQEISMNPMSSFTTDFETARSFGKNAIVAEVPAERIIATPFTGQGCYGEYEWVILGLPEEEVFLGGTADALAKALGLR